MNYLIDTNILIYYFNGLIKDDKIDKILETSFNISIITKIEFLSWSKLAQDKVLDEKAQAFVSYATLFELNDQVAQKTIEIRRKYKTKTPDAIIAATALVNDMSIVTHNISDFSSLEVEIVGVGVEL
ncbi:MAG: type II toxin-antitoxin system VapC family toxin [Bacteroidales bacterium]|nr:type II toxin-antitoxin system VapC family toxin [Bacteroidales bacterium]